MCLKTANGCTFHKSCEGKKKAVILIDIKKVEETHIQKNFVLLEYVFQKKIIW